eukprot:5953694-Amphidinium_carterae.1
MVDDPRIDQRKLRRSVLNQAMVMANKAGDHVVLSEALGLEQSATSWEYADELSIYAYVARRLCSLPMALSRLGLNSI